MPPLTAERLVFITLVDGVPTPSVDPVQLDTTKGHVAHWIFAGDGDLQITMKDVTPFDSPHEHAGQHVRSSIVRQDAEGGGRRYGYTITLTIGEDAFTNDPDIEIVP